MAIADEIKDVQDKLALTVKGLNFSLPGLLVSFLQTFINLAYYLFLVAILITGFMYLISGADEDKVKAAKKNFIFCVSGFAMVALAYSILAFVVSQTEGIVDAPDAPDAPAVNIETRFNDITATVFGFVTALAGAAFLLMLLSGGFKYMTSAGIEETADNAKKQMVNAAIGLALVAFSYTIGITIIKLIFAIG